MDPDNVSMEPPVGGKKRKTLSWTGFYITDEELPVIVDRVMRAYELSWLESGPVQTVRS